MMKKLAFASALAAAVAAPAALVAPSAAVAADSPHSLSANVGLFSNYIFRGISQTGGKPAIQGGFDYAHSSGLYVGTWASNVSWLSDFGAYGRSSLEWDFYGGWKPTVGDFTFDIGTLYYYYPGSRNSGFFDANTWEVYAGAGWKWLSVKYSYSLQDYFGARPTGEKTNGTWYLDFGVAVPFGDSGFAANAHYGILDVRNDGSGATKASYNDWKIGASYTFGSNMGILNALELGAFYTGNTAERAFYTDLTGYDTSKNAFVFYGKKTF